MLGCIEVKHPSPIVAQDNQRKKHLERGFGTVKKSSAIVPLT
jgi:hypothetical protein